MNFKILVVDDEEIMCTLLKEVLSAEGHDVYTASNGVDALGVLEEEGCDIILSDIRMPDMDGLKLLHAIIERDPEKIVIMMTGYATLATAREAIKEGAYDYLMKPFDIEGVRRSIKKAAERRRLYLENERLKTIMPLFEISNRLIETRESEQLLELILMSAMNQTKSPKGAIVLFAKNNDLPLSVLKRDLELDSSHNDLGKKAIEKLLSGANGLLVTRNDKHPLIGKMPRVKTLPFAGEPGAGDAVLCPITVRREDTVGCVIVQKDTTQDSFSEGDCDLLAVLSNQAGTSIENSRLIKDLEQVSVSTLQSLVLILEAKSPYTSGHSLRVSRYARLIALELGFDEKEVKRVEAGGMLHDIGKIGVSEDILIKPAPLTPEEYEQVKRHPVIGDEMLAPLAYLRDVRPLIRHHHERMDGLGYPDGIKAGMLSVSERIMVVADAYEAMLAKRPFRGIIGVKNAREELLEHKRTQFDADLVDVVIRLSEKGSLTLDE
ncbi:MAG: response regulator [Candidatus Omnitrophica bacterium]|nr:response regulator [Candidatus Omnitrophota bacterium]